MIGSTPPRFTVVGTNGDIVDKNGIDGNRVDVGVRIVGVTKGLLKLPIPSGKIVGSTGRTLWERFDRGTG